MPRNPNKRSCRENGCHVGAGGHHSGQVAEAQRGSQPAPEEGAPDPGSLLRSAVHHDDLVGADLARIDKELRQLLKARAFFQAWTKELRAGKAVGFSPAQYLRAWNDSTTRVVQLLRARRALAGEEDAQGPFGALIAEVYDLTDMLLPDADRDGEKGGQDGA